MLAKPSKSGSNSNSNKLYESTRSSTSTSSSRNVAFKSDKIMDALFQEGPSAPQTPQPFFDADFEGLASNAELYIFNQDDSQE